MGWPSLSPSGQLLKLTDSTTGAIRFESIPTLAEIEAMERAKGPSTHLLDLR